MAATKRKLRQARAMSVGGKARRPRTRPSLRAPIGAVVLAVVGLLQAELTLAPTVAGQPDLASTIAPAPVAAAGVPPVADIRPPRAAGVQRAAAPRVAPPVDGARFQAALDAARVSAGAYGVTFAVVRDGQVLWAGSSGVSRTGRDRLAPGDAMVIGSVTKTFVAATVLQLVQEGRLALDDSARTYLPELRRVSRQITIEQLLDHTSGLADLFNDTTKLGLEQHPERAWTSAEVLSTLHAPWYKPGEGWAYANTNYHLLGLIVERVTGSSLAAELRRRFLDPLSLASTRMLTADDPTSPLSPAWATIFWASGAMSSSAPDLARWGDALLDGGVLADATLDEMLDVNRDDYGLGVKRFELPGRVGYGHTGLLNTYTTLLLHLPGDDVTIAMLVNRTNVELIEMLKERPNGTGPSLLRLAIDS